MISLRKSLADMERLEELFRASLQCYVAAINRIDDHSVATDTTVTASHRRRLREIEKEGAADPAQAVLDQSRAQLDAVLREYAEQAEQFFRHREDQIRKILEALAGAAGVLSSRNEAYADQFQDLAKQLEIVSQMGDLTEVRRRLTASVTQLKDCVDSSVSGMQQQLKMFHRRLEQAEALAATDPLTGLVNRREAERLMEEKARARELFSVMLFDLDEFKRINDHYGHPVGDQVLRAFSKRLFQQYRSCHVVCRWGGDEFLVIVNSPVKDCIARARQVAESLRGRYSIRSAGKEYVVEVLTSVGVAELKPGETVEQLLARADEFLYHHKAAQDAG